MKTLNIKLILAKSLLIQTNPFSVEYDALRKLINDADRLPDYKPSFIFEKLKRPLIFFDIESTGANPATDRIISLDCIKLDPENGTIKEGWLLNPMVNIPFEASEVHGIFNDDVKDRPSFRQVAKDILDFFAGCDLAHFNGDQFDVPILVQEFDRAGIQFDMSTRYSLDVSQIFRKKQPRTLSAAVEFYCGEEHHEAHTSAADTEATLNVFLRQMERYPDFAQLELAELAAAVKHDPDAVDLAGKLRKNKNGLTVYAFGKNQGVPVANDRNYANWMLNADFTADTKNHLRKAIGK